MAYFEKEGGLWNNGSDIKSFERLLERHFSEHDVRMANDEAIRAAWYAFQLSVKKQEERWASFEIDIDQYFQPIEHCHVPSAYQDALSIYRQQVRMLGISDKTPLCYRIHEGFTLLDHACRAGSCDEDLKLLRGLAFEDRPTENGILFWIPSIMEFSESPSGPDFLESLRQVLGLPKGHLAGYVEASLVAGLLLANDKAKGEHVCSFEAWVPTSTKISEGPSIYLSYDQGIFCDAESADDLHEKLVLPISFFPIAE